MVIPAYKQFKSWAEEYDSATMEQKKKCIWIKHKPIYKTLDKYLVNDKMNIRMSKCIS